MIIYDFDTTEETVTQTFTDPSITSTADLRSAVRTHLAEAIQQDSLTGRLDITPVAILPGKAYTISE